MKEIKSDIQKKTSIDFPEYNPEMLKNILKDIKKIVNDEEEDFTVVELNNIFVPDAQEQTHPMKNMEMKNNTQQNIEQDVVKATTDHLKKLSQLAKIKSTTIEEIALTAIQPIIQEWSSEHLESVIKELIREWINKNLPDIVKNAVDNEIKKILE